MCNGACNPLSCPACAAWDWNGSSRLVCVSFARSSAMRISRRHYFDVSGHHRKALQQSDQFLDSYGL